jgi:hypothetical protein
LRKDVIYEYGFCSGRGSIEMTSLNMTNILNECTQADSRFDTYLSLPTSQRLHPASNGVTALNESEVAGRKERVMDVVY